MRMVVAAALLALAACAPEAENAAQAESTPPALEPAALPQSDGAGNRLEELTQRGEGERWCNEGDAWCVTIVDASTLAVAGPGVATNAVLPAVAEGWSRELWRTIVVVNGRAMIGTIETDSQMYSGGGGTAQQLVLQEVANGSAREVLRLPYAGSLDIRACFSEDDVTQRLDACSDQYQFVSRIRLDETVTSGDPRIVLETAAGTFPGRVTRGDDSGERGQLTEADLTWWHDDVCSFRRTYSKSAQGPYVPDAELPACSDYLEP